MNDETYEFIIKEIIKHLSFKTKHAVDFLQIPGKDFREREKNKKYILRFHKKLKEMSPERLYVIFQILVLDYWGILEKISEQKIKIKCVKCGSVTEYDYEFIGRFSSIANYIAPLCKDCNKFIQEEIYRRAKKTFEYDLKYHLPEIKAASKKQKKFAEDMRIQFLYAVTRNENQLENYITYIFDDLLVKETRARFWIDNRKHFQDINSLKTFLSEIYGEEPLPPYFLIRAENTNEYIKYLNQNTIFSKKVDSFGIFIVAEIAKNEEKSYVQISFESYDLPDEILDLLYKNLFRFENNFWRRDIKKMDINIDDLVINISTKLFNSGISIRIFDKALRERLVKVLTKKEECPLVSSYWIYVYKENKEHFGKIAFKFPYDKKVISELKHIPNINYLKEEKIWVVSVESYMYVVDFYNEHKEFAMTKEAKEYINFLYLKEKEIQFIEIEPSEFAVEFLRKNGDEIDLFSLDGGIDELEDTE